MVYMECKSVHNLLLQPEQNVGKYGADDDIPTEGGVARVFNSEFVSKAAVIS
jgi:hypothetical protein